MFEARLRSEPMDDYLTQLMAVGDESVIHVSGNGLAARHVDPANVAMVDTTMPAEAFESLDVDGEGRALGINLSRFSDVVDTAESGDSLDLDFDSETRKLQTTVNGLTYTMALIDPDSIRAEPDIPDLDYNAEVSIPVSEFKRGIDAADMVGDTIEVGTNEDGEFAMQASGDTDDVNYTPENASVTPGSAGDPEDVTSIFSLDYMKDIIKAIPADEMTVWVANEMPVSLEYEYEVATDDDDDETVTAEGEFMVAPRIQSD